MPIPPLRDMITPTSTVASLPADTVNERLLLTLAMLATGQAPDGTSLPGGGAVLRLGPLITTATGIVSGLPTLNGISTVNLGPLTTTATGSSGATTPPVAGYTAWYDASQITGQADGSSLASWPDLSGNGNNLSQATPANQPTYYSSTAGKLINGKPTVSYNGTSTSMATAAATVATGQPFSLFMVLNCTDSNNFRGLLSRNGLPWDFYFVSGQPYDQFYSSAGAFGNTITFGTPELIELQWDGTTVNFWLNGGSNISQAVASAPGGSGPYYLGNRAAGDTPYLGLFAEIIYYTSVLSTVNRQSTESYLRAKWGTP